MIVWGHTYSSEKIIRAIGECRYVSFDIFDTLIKRSVAKPSDVFLTVARRYGHLHQCDFDAETFKTVRTNAGKDASLEAKKKGHEERTLQEIYQQMAWKYGADVCVELMQLEIEQEVACCQQNAEMKKVYDWCLSQGKTILITSDMYLPEDTITHILHENGYTGYKELFLSSSCDKQKASGSLYRKIICQYDMKRKQLVHIGDHLKIDYMRARQYGLKAIKIPQHVENGKYDRKGFWGHETAEYRQIEHIAANFSQDDWSGYRQYGFECIGPMLYGFCTWLHRRAQEQGCKKLFFLSRDGYMMQEAYNMLYGNDAIPNSYMYASRKSLFGPQVWMKPELEDILKQETPYHYWDVDELCEMLDVDKVNGRKTWKDCGIGEKERLMKKELFTDQRITKFFEAVKPAMIASSKTKFDTVIDYLKQENFHGQVGIVDVGWAGAIQRYLQRFTEEAKIDVSIYGFYLGLKPITVTGPNADAYIPQVLGPSMFCSNLMEYPFTKEEGSARGYKHGEDGRVIPIKSDYEFEGMEDKRYTHDMQEGALHYVRLMKSGYGVREISWQAGYRNVMNVTKRPRIMDVRLLGRLSHVNHGRRVFLAVPKRRWSYLLHPRQLKEDFIDSGWKIGFLKSLFLLPLPYNSILKLIRKNG